MRDFNSTLAVSALLLSIVGSAVAVRMSPAAFTAQNVPLGEKFDLTVPLVISLGDDSSSSVDFLAQPIFPSEVRDKWLRGYLEIPEADYLIVDGEMPISVTPDEPAIRKLFINFPDDSAYLNCHFLAHLKIMPAKVSGMFQAVLVGSYLLETVSSKDRFAKPGFGLLTGAPSVLDMEGPSTVRIYNNSDRSIDIGVYLDVPSDEKKLHVEPSAGYIIGDTTDFVLNIADKTIPADGFIDIPISFKNNRYRETLQRNTEVILWVEDVSNSEIACFIRIHCRP